MGSDQRKMSKEASSANRMFLFHQRSSLTGLTESDDSERSATEGSNMVENLLPHDANDSWQPGDLGDRVRMIQLQRDGDERNRDFRGLFWRKMNIALVCILGSAAMLHGLIGLAQRMLMPKDYNNEKMFNTFFEENVYEDIVKDVVPSIQTWYRAMDDKEPLLPDYRHKTISPTGADCVDRFFDRMETVVNMTSPAQVELVLKSLGLANSMPTRIALQRLLEKPQPLSEWIAETSSCYAQATSIGHLCDAYESNIGTQTDFDLPYQRNVLIYFANTFAVYQTLTVQALHDVPLLSEISSKMIDVYEFRERGYEAMQVDESIIDFVKMKYQGVAQSIQVLKHAIAESKTTLSVRNLQINILEATNIDADLGHLENAKLGLALAAAASVDPVAEDHAVHWMLGREWVESYLSWNIAFVLGSLPIDMVIKLMIPAVACTPTMTPDGNGFIPPRIISLALTLMHQFPPMEDLTKLVDDETAAGDRSKREHKLNNETIQDIYRFYKSAVTGLPALHEKQFDVVQTLGQSNLQHAIVPTPSYDTVERMLYTLCGTFCYDGSYPLSWTGIEVHLEDDEFNTYIGIILYITAMLSGLGLEIFVLASLSGGKQWSTKHETFWWFAQFLFPLLAATCLGLSTMKNFMALPFLVVGLWKLGMPETISYMYVALYTNTHTFTQDSCNFSLGQLASFANSVGNIMHHSASSLVVTMFLSGAATADRHMLAPIVVLIMQHWFALLKYRHLYLFCLIEIILEAYFEWTVLSELHYVHSRHPSIGFASLAMLVAHWLYFFAGFLELIESNEANGGSLEGACIPEEVTSLKEQSDEDTASLNNRHEEESEAIEV